MLVLFFFQHQTWRSESAELLRFLMGVCDDLLFRWYRKLSVSQTVDCRCSFCRAHPTEARALLFSELQQAVAEGRHTLECMQQYQCSEMVLLEKPGNKETGLVSLMCICACECFDTLLLIFSVLLSLSDYWSILVSLPPSVSD
jgi:hypothetical protein